jgi:hypothetical protein
VGVLSTGGSKEIHKSIYSNKLQGRWSALMFTNKREVINLENIDINMVKRLLVNIQK